MYSLHNAFTFIEVLSSKATLAFACSHLLSSFNNPLFSFSYLSVVLWLFLTFFPFNINAYITLFNLLSSAYHFKFLLWLATLVIIHHIILVREDWRIKVRVLRLYIYNVRVHYARRGQQYCDMVLCDSAG